MAINEPMIKQVMNVIESSGKYVDLNITGDFLTEIPEHGAFSSREMLVGITIPKSVTSIGWAAFAPTFSE